MALTALEEQLFGVISSLLDIQNKLVWLVQSYRDQSDVQVVTSATEVLKRQISSIVQYQTGPLNRSDIKDLIGRRSSPKDLGPLIDVAHSLGILDNATYDIARNIKEIRDIFAHNTSLIMLHVEPALSAFKKLHTNPDFSGSYSSVFLSYTSLVSNYLGSYAASLGNGTSCSDRSTG